MYMSNLFQNCWIFNKKRIAEQMLSDVTGDPDMLKRVITGDKTWVYG